MAAQAQALPGSRSGSTFMIPRLVPALLQPALPPQSAHAFSRDPPRLFLRPGFRGSGAWLGPGWARGRPVAGVMTSPWRSTGHRWGAAASVTQAAAGPGAGWVQRRWWPRTSGWERHAAQPVQREEELVRPGPAGG